MNELSKRIEAILFASGKGVSVQSLAEFAESSQAKIKKALELLQDYYHEQDSSLTISEYEQKWKLTVKASYTEYIQKLVSEAELQPALLKTLAVIAYKSPVMQSDVVSMRGQVSYEHVKHLAKEKFITKEESGRSYLLKITDKFYNYFDIEGDQEIREVFSQLRGQEERRAELEKELEQQQKLGDLKVVDTDGTKDHDTIFAPVRKEKTEEEKKEEEDFLDDIDSRISKLSERVTEQELPKKTADTEGNTQEETEEKKEEEDYI